MNNVKDSNNVSASRVKIIRDESFDRLPWDNKGDSYTNNWSTSTLKYLLNEGAYYNRSAQYITKYAGVCSGTAKYGTDGKIECENVVASNIVESASFYTTGLTEEAKGMISSVVWNLGGSNTNISANEFYIAERGANVYSGNPTTWTGEVGLMYPSDYLYATSGGSAGRNTCITTIANNWSNTYNLCHENDWLYKNGVYKWTITSVLSNSLKAFALTADGSVAGYYQVYNSYDDFIVNPVVYLNVNLKVIGGNGLAGSPYIINE